MSDMQEQLSLAYDLIEDDQEQQALAILRPMVKNDPTNADAWWLISYAVDDPKEARQALVNVLKLNPNHEKARDMLTQVNEFDPPTPQEIALLKEVPDPDGSLTRMPLPESRRFDFDEDIYADLLGEGQKKSDGLPLPFQIAIGITMVAIVVLLGYALISEKDADKDTGREDLAALESSGDTDALAGFNLAGDSSAIVADTALGKTLFVETCVCTSRNCGGPAPQDLPEVVLASVKTATEQLVSTDAEADIAGVGVNVVACQSRTESHNDIIYRGFAPLASVMDYENLTLAVLQSNWTVQQ